MDHRGRPTTKVKTRTLPLWWVPVGLRLETGKENPCTLQSRVVSQAVDRAVADAVYAELVKFVDMRS
jgi:hypothetical protein